MEDGRGLVKVRKNVNKRKEYWIKRTKNPASVAKEIIVDNFSF